MKKLVTKTRETDLLFEFDLKKKLNVLFLIVSIVKIQANEISSQRNIMTLNFDKTKEERLPDRIKDKIQHEFVYKTDEIDPVSKE